jgi:cytochrome o ubiquinol oxidase subunit 3
MHKKYKKYMTEHILTIEKEREENEITFLGFWIYLMTDLVMFSVLFATYAVLHGSTFGGPTSYDLFKLPFVLRETLVLLASSFTMGLTMLALQKQKITSVISWLCVTGLLGAIFLSMEIYEFSHLIKDGARFTRSAFLSAYFSLVGTHGLHIAVGLLWISIMTVMIMKRGLSESMVRKVTLLSLFWHFLDIVWIFIFTMVYLMGTLH